ncbi:MAG: C39 family peptidase [Phycisphaerae bacterium]
MPQSSLILCESASDFAAAVIERGRFDGDTVVLKPEPGAGADITSLSGGATLTSPPVASPIPFNDVLMSWNIETPPDAGFAAELRVGRREEAWSPWLHVGEWGAWSDPSPRVTSFEDGRIDVDYFRSDQRFGRAQYRIRATSRGGAPGAAIHVRRVALCFSDMTSHDRHGASGSAGLPDARKPQSTVSPSSRAARRLDVPFRSQQAEPADVSGRICSPTSLAMVLGYRGVDLPTSVVASTCYDPGHDIYGNWTRAIQGAFSLGVPGYLTRFSDWDAVQRCIANNQPLIISIKVREPGGLAGAPYQATDGHLLVLCGFTSDGDVHVNDPASRTAETGIRVYRRAEMERAWLRDGGGVAYVLETRTPLP